MQIDNNNDREVLAIKYTNRFLKTNTVIGLTGYGIIQTILIYLTLSIIGDDWWEMTFVFLCVPLTIFIILFGLLPNLLTLNYINKNKRYKLSLVFNILTACVYLIAITYLTCSLWKITSYKEGISIHKIILLVLCNIFLIHVLINITLLILSKRNVDQKELRLRSIQLIIICAVFFLLNMGVFTTLNYKYNHLIKQSNITWEETEKYTYLDFKNELINRNLYYEKNKPPYRGVLAAQIKARNSEREYSFTNNKTAVDSSNLYEKSSDTFPYFSYGIYNDGYLSLMQKSKLTADYYEIGPEDSYAAWGIYWVNGNIYAKLNCVSKLDSNNYSKKEIIVSETPDIYLYDTSHRKPNGYYPEYLTDGVLKECTNDTFDGEYIVVDRLDAETLDKISIEFFQK